MINLELFKLQQDENELSCDFNCGYSGRCLSGICKCTGNYYGKKCENFLVYIPLNTL